MSKSPRPQIRAKRVKTKLVISTPDHKPRNFWEQILRLLREVRSAVIPDVTFERDHLELEISEHDFERANELAETLLREEAHAQLEQSAVQAERKRLEPAKRKLTEHKPQERSDLERKIQELRAEGYDVTLRPETEEEATKRLLGNTESASDETEAPTP